MDPEATGDDPVSAAFWRQPDGRVAGIRYTRGQILDDVAMDALREAVRSGRPVIQIDLDAMFDTIERRIQNSARIAPQSSANPRCAWSSRPRPNPQPSIERRNDQVIAAKTNGPPCGGQPIQNHSGLRGERDTDDSPKGTSGTIPDPLTAALELAATGIPVFPCKDSKAPACANGFVDASTDPATIRRLFARSDAVLVGCPPAP